MPRPLMLLRTVFCLAIVWIAAPSLDAQTVLPRGARVRVTLDTGRARTATFVRVAADTIVFRRCATCREEDHPLAMIRSLDVSAGHHVDGDRVRLGVVLGAVAGAAIGVVQGERKDRSCGCNIGRVVDPLAGAVLGALAGMIPAFAFPVERWRPVRLGT